MSESGKRNALLNLINHQPGIYKIYLYAEDPYKPKYQLLIKQCEDLDLFTDPKFFNEYFSDIQDINGST